MSIFVTPTCSCARPDVLNATAEFHRQPVAFKNIAVETILPQRVCLQDLCEILVCRYIKLAARHPESNTAGMDIFAKFSAFIKNPRPDANEGTMREALK